MAHVSLPARQVQADKRRYFSQKHEAQFAQSIAHINDAHTKKNGYVKINSQLLTFSFIYDCLFCYTTIQYLSLRVPFKSNVGLHLVVYSKKKYKTLINFSSFNFAIVKLMMSI